MWFYSWRFTSGQCIDEENFKTEIEIGSYKVKLYGYRTLLMDLELSKVNTGASATELFKDVKLFVNKMLNLADFVDIIKIAEANTQLRDWIESKESNPDKLLDLLPLFDEIRSTGFKGIGGWSLKRNRNVKPKI